jgi:HECT-domain (ubiquitin-transferase)
MALCGGPALHLFNATELERLVCGNPILDFSALQGAARYEGGYDKDHRVSSMRTLLLAANQGPNVIFKVLNRTKCVLLFPASPARWK